MPLPKLPKSGEITRAQVVELYESEPYNWVKSLVFPWIEVDQRTGSIMKVTYRFDADANPCSDRTCVQYQLTFLQLRPTGVYKTCAICRRTEGPITRRLGIIEDRVPVTIKEAWDTVNLSGQSPPKGLQPLQSGGSLRIIR
jgi:hypothetical protein